MSVKIKKTIKKSLLICNIEFEMERFFIFCLHPKSRRFCFESDFEIQEGIEGTIRVYPRGTDDNILENWISVITSVRTKSESDIYAKLDLSIRSFDGLEKIEKLSAYYRFLHSREEVWDMSKFTTTQNILQHGGKFIGPMGTLKLYLTLSVHLDRTANRWISSIYDAPVRRRLREMLKNKTGEQRFDIMFTIGKCQFQAHRQVVKCHPVVQGILQRSDPQCQLFDLPNFRPDSFENLLIDSYMDSSLFCKRCFIDRKKGAWSCCNAKNKYGS
ncbi:unnamed protein product [Hermetia illucens]|uniref:BTB domain-containing protein n=1 Tax=Hermetia illucens TaxID=343691 RepID=A0A7R8YW37_HERIL|nr:unnamed protein product [Hermetia illucens]